MVHWYKDESVLRRVSVKTTGRVIVKVSPYESHQYEAFGELNGKKRVSDNPNYK